MWVVGADGTVGKGKDSLSVRLGLARVGLVHKGVQWLLRTG